MRLPLFIAGRYLFAKKSHHVINIISWISMTGIVVGAMGLIIVLSVFNGFGDLVISLYNSFDPDIRITAVKGKTLDPASVNLKDVEGIRSVTYSLEENALLRTGDRQFIATIKGVDEAFLEVSGVSDRIVDGEPVLTAGEENFAIAGGSIAYFLGISLDNPFNAISVYIPKKGKPVSFVNPEEAFNIGLIRPSGVFAIQQDFDSKYVLVPMRFARNIIGEERKVTSAEIYLEPNADPDAAAAAIAALNGPDIKAETRLQQHAILYKILKSEKWAVYMILTLIIIIAIFNIIGSLSMLIIEKKKDIGIYRSMGADTMMIRKIFITEGMMITAAGSFTGILLGGLVCFLQMQFGLIKLENAGSFVVDAYPVAMQAGDFLGVFCTILLIGTLASLYTSRRLIPELKAHETALRV